MSEAVRRRSTYHHGNLHDALIEATIAEIEESGVEALSLRRVAQRSGVTAGAPFRHFASKRELLSAVALVATQRLLALVDAAIMENGSGAALDRFRAFGTAYIDWALNHPTHLRVVSDRQLIAGDGAAAIAPLNQQLRQKLAKILADAQAEGSIGPSTAPTELMLDARAFVYGLARMCVDGQLSEWSVAGTSPRDAMIAALNRFIARLA